MGKLNGDNIINEIIFAALLYTDQELKKHFSEDAPKVFRRIAKRIEETYQRGEDEENTETKTK